MNRNLTRIFSDPPKTYWFESGRFSDGPGQVLSPNKRDIKEMKIGLGFDISDIYIYIYRYFSYFTLSLNRLGRVRVQDKFLPKPGPTLGFFF